MNHSIAFQGDGWNDYVYWQTQDKKTLKKINKLIEDIQKHPFSGIGKPEPLKYDYQGFWSREIDDKNRIIYHIKNDTTFIAGCRTHYGDK
jgi:toxin YoeB